MKIATVVGARPQFIKSATISRAISSHNQSSNFPIEEVIIHTGQHFDKNMSDIFFKELDIVEPEYNLNIKGLGHGAMTGRMMEEIEKALFKIMPDILLIYGDTNSTLAGALAASKMQIPIIAHVESGLRSFNRNMPEEVNRVVSDHLSTHLYCPTETAVKNLSNEGITKGVINSGDVMYDACLYFKENISTGFDFKEKGLKKKEYALCTIHRQENTDNPDNLDSIFSALQTISKDLEVALVMHPRTLKQIKEYSRLNLLKGLKVLDPVSYFEFQSLEMNSKYILTDSGGIQKEAYFHSIPCLTLRDETEWIETIDSGWNQIVSSNTDDILLAFDQIDSRRRTRIDSYGNGYAAEIILGDLIKKA